MARAFEPEPGLVPPLGHHFQFSRCLKPKTGLKRVFLVPFVETMCGYYEKKLLNDLIADYNALERPVVNESEPLLLTFGITLQQIIDVVSQR